MLEAQLRHRKPCQQVACTRSANWAHALRGCDEEDIQEQAYLPRLELPSWERNLILSLCVWFILKPNKVLRLLLPLSFALSLRGGPPPLLAKEYSWALWPISQSCAPRSS